MSGNSLCFVEWKEEFVSQERGNRVVHYFLKDFAGESVLAVVGTERSVRHMFYVIAEEFLEAHGKENSVHSGFKWRSRREVVDWLTSMLSKQHLHEDRSDTHDSTKALGFPEYSMNGITQHAQAPDGMGRFAKSFRSRNSDIFWSGSPWMCGKQLKHYPSFCRNGITIPIQSFVFVMAKGENHYVAYLEDMYEDKRGQKKVKVRWFHHNQEVRGVVLLRNPHPKEVFITQYAQVISAECVDGLATVLNREDYEKCLAAIPHGFLAKVHMCYRQFRNNRTKPFDLTKLRGYFDQPILSCLGPDSFTPPKGWEEENGDNERRSGKRSRSAIDPSGDTVLAKDRHTKLSCSSLKKGLFSLKHSVGQPWFSQQFKVDDKIELLCQDSGIRGCWFRCTVLEVSKKQIKVQYDDLQDEDGCGNIEEWIPVFKSAMADKLGTRKPNRPMIRPISSKEPTELSLEIGTAVDAWWSDGWWEGIVTDLDSSPDNVQVYFPGESLLLGIDKKDLRISREWLGDRWTNIEAKPDIVSVISEPISSSGTKPSMSSSTQEDLTDTKPITTIEDENQNLNLTTTTMLPNSDNPSEAKDLVNPEKSPSLRENITNDDANNNDGGVNADDILESNSPKVNDCDGEKDENSDVIKLDVVKEIGTSEQSCKAAETTMEVRA